MHLFLVDETNRDFVEDHFFIVGGLVFRPDQFAAVDAAVALRRAQAGFRPGDSFKFDTNARPGYVDAAQHREAKKDLVADLHQIGVRMIVSVVLHDLAANQDYNTRMEWALNTVAGAYARLLQADGGHGMMLMDRDNDRFDHLEYLFQHGLRMWNGNHVTVSDRIKLFGMTNDNASNLSSAADVALGAFRYCANTAVGNGREPVAREMFPNLAKIMWSVVDRSGNLLIGGYGYNPRPKRERIGSPAMLKRYDDLAAALASYSIDEMDGSGPARS